MTESFVRYTHSFVNGACAWAGMAGDFLAVHDTHMAGKPKWRITNLRVWREERDISLETAAAAMGITHGQLSKIERGFHPYNQNVLEVGAKLYDCTVADLLSRRPGEAETVLETAERLVQAVRSGSKKKK